MSESLLGLSMNGKSKRIRGRPVGSGIDDRQRLAQIAQLLTSNPEMKPTTAIKAIGIVDPSARRTPAAIGSVAGAWIEHAEGRNIAIEGDVIYRNGVRASGKI